VAGDALSIINYINSFDFSEVPDDAQIGQPFGFLDTTHDNNVAPDDVLSVINAINAINSEPGGEGESPANEKRAYASTDQLSSSPAYSFDELIGLLALDIDSQTKRRR
jgi:hypothetical protein